MKDIRWDCELSVTIMSVNQTTACHQLELAGDHLLLIVWSRTTPTIQSIDISFETANFRKHIRSYKKNTFETDTLEATENDVVNIASLLWWRRFNPKRQKNTWNTPCFKKHVLANNISNAENSKKDCSWKDGLDKLVELSALSYFKTQNLTKCIWRLTRSCVRKICQHFYH